MPARSVRAEPQAAKNVAVLINADNTIVKHARAIFDEIIQRSEADVRRKDGGIANNRLASRDAAIQSRRNHTMLARGSRSTALPAVQWMPSGRFQISRCRAGASDCHGDRMVGARGARWPGPVEPLPHVYLLTAAARFPIIWLTATQLCADFHFVFVAKAATHGSPVVPVAMYALGRPNRSCCRLPRRQVLLGKWKGMRRETLSPWHLGPSTRVAAEAQCPFGRQPRRQPCHPVPL